MLVLVACGPAVEIGEAGSSSSSDGPIDPSTTVPGTASAEGGTGTSGPGTSGPGTTPTSGPTSDATTEEGSFVSTISFLDDGSDTSVSIECDLWSDDCPDGEKCMPWANDGGGTWNATRCSPIDPNPAQPGEPCTVEGSGVSGIDNCALHSMCFHVDPETNTGTCVAMCIGNEAEPGCEDACSSCSLTGDGILILCLPNCDPLVADACSPGDVCVPVNDSFACVIDASAEVGAVGDACEFVNGCDPGLFCASADLLPACEDATGCCTPFCNLDAADGCDALVPGTVCMPWFGKGGEPPPCVTDSIGACVAA